MPVWIADSSLSFVIHDCNCDYSVILDYRFVTVKESVPDQANIGAIVA